MQFIIINRILITTSTPERMLLVAPLARPARGQLGIAVAVAPVVVDGGREVARVVIPFTACTCTCTCIREMRADGQYLNQANALLGWFSREAKEK